MFAGPQYGTCFMSPIWYLEFWGWAFLQGSEILNWENWQRLMGPWWWLWEEKDAVHIRRRDKDLKQL